MSTQYQFLYKNSNRVKVKGIKGASLTGKSLGISIY